jgi:hypothetical protein
MAHLTPDQLLDVADGTRTDGEFVHLQSCAVCARQLAGLRDVIRDAKDVTVPEPSPLFWDHLSARVRRAVAEDGRNAVRPGYWWRWAAAVAAIGALVLVLRPLVPLSIGGIPDTRSGVSADLMPRHNLRAFDDDPALALLADLSAGLDWEAAAEAGLVPARDAVDSVVFDLSDEERVELHRLLQEALAGAGA